MMKYIREGTLPTFYCPGCGIGTVQNVFFHAIDQLGMDPKDIAVVCGIGCSGLTLSPFFEADTLHTTHGRPIAFATGLKVSKPDMNVMVVSGDGDLAGIGGNHLIHAARRNIDLKVFCLNNMIYGNTGGQFSPTTPHGFSTVTSPYGNLEDQFDLVQLVASAGASYVARWTTAHPTALLKSVKRALETKGFTFVEIMSQCPTHYGRRAGLGKPTDFIKYFKDKAVRYKPDKSEEILNNLQENDILVGEFMRRERKELTEKLRWLINHQSCKSG
jgi:2-oxoglutarate ferredoxin oxidoreductase subunit beta